MTVNELLMSLEIGLIYGITAIGIYLTFRIIDFPDLTCDGSFMLGAAVSSVLLKANAHYSTALLIALLSGAFSGCVTGILHTRFRVSNLLSGILVAFILYSINLRIMNGIPNITLIDLNTVFSNTAVLAILGGLSLLIAALLSYVLLTDFGLGLRSIGQNKRLAQNGGINIKTMTLVGLALSNSLIALSGALFSQHQGFADVGQGTGTIIVGLASVMIGERLLQASSLALQLLSCLLGSVLYRLLISFALHAEFLGLESQDLNLITGLMVIGIVYLSPKSPREFQC